MLNFDLGQTFFVDKQSVEGSDVAFITSIDLYFYSKPTQNQTVTGIHNPGASVYLCGTKTDGSPDPSTINQIYGARVEYSNINVSTTGATSTKFTFRQPVRVSTDRSIAFLVKFDGSDKNFKLWGNKAGQLGINSSSVTQVSSGSVDGYLYKITNGSSLTPQTDTDLTFKVNVAKFSGTSSTFVIRNRPYETLKLVNQNGAFKGGEYVYQQRSYLTGTVNCVATSTTIQGIGTAFNSTLVVGDQLILTDTTTGNTNVRVVGSIINSTSVVLTEEPTFTNTSARYYKTVIGKAFTYDSMSDYLIMQDSNANSSLYLQVSNTVIGVDSQASGNISSIVNYAVNSVIPNFNIRTPVGTSANITLNFANSSGSVAPAAIISGTLGVRNSLNRYPAIMASRTNEVTAGVPYRSFAGTLTFSTTNPYVSPFVSEEDLDLFAERYEINNTATNEYKGQGSASARYVSKAVTLANSQQAEDLKIYLTAYRPSNTNILVYAKFLNTDDIETLDIKDWTQLTLNQSNTVVTNPTNLNDRVEYSFSVPAYNSGVRATGVFETSLSSATITGTSGIVNSEIVPGAVVRVYSPTLPATYFTDTVISSTSSAMVLSRVVSNTSLVGTGFLVDVISTKNSAFIDNQNQNVLTYYNKSLSKFQTYNSFALKIVLLSDDGVNIPFVDDVRAIAVSA
jgi:hypothetical protein